VIDDVAALTRHCLGGLRVALERHADGIGITCRSAKMRMRREKPTRLPYS
jgi:hypothetical protein